MNTSILQKTIRLFKSNKLLFSINILGLSIGIASFIILILWVTKEKGYNTFLKDKDVYQVVTTYTVNGGIRSARTTSLPLVRAMSQDIPGITTVAYTKPADGLNLKTTQKQTRSNGRYASSSIFKIFPQPFLMGSPDRALDDPAAIVISADVAERLYGKDWRTQMDNNIISLENKEWLVKGVFESFPGNSTFRSDFFLPMPKDTNEHIGSYNYETYLKLESQINPQTVAAGINQKIAGITKSAVTLQAFQDIHLYSNFSNGIVDGGRILYVRLFTIAAFFLLGMACINFMNLYIASSFKRTKELSVKRIIGADRTSLVMQLVGEAYITVFIAIVLALVMVFLLLPSINVYLAENLHFPLQSWRFWLFIVGVFAVTGVLASIYPALRLTSFNPLSVLKSSQGAKIGGIGITKILFTLQFFISVFLIYIAFTTNRQVQYLLHKDLGYSKENIVGKKLSREEIEKIPVLKAELAAKSFVTSQTFSSSNLISGTPMTGDVTWTGKLPADSVRFAVLYTDKDFSATFKLKMLTGGFGAEYGADLPVVINKKAARIMGGEAAILNKTINVFGNNCRVTGIVDDFNFTSLYNPIDPLIIADYPAESEYIFARPVPGREADVVAYMETLGRKDNSGKAENYFWVEDTLHTLYKDEANLGKRSFLFSIVCILIALSGFFGLVNFSIIKRTREMGIRKIFGSAQHQIVFLIFRDFLKWIAVAALIAIPVSYMFLNNWLEKFPYRIYLNPASFVIPLLGMGAIIFLIVVFYALRLGRINPIRVLRDE
ncbi:ABC transporter permease [Chitinophaga rhizophila]|uniref:ABC transporter permease n=1 Tax=Chitinophaga rhizophila TaxID=2866212 RepID=A0ABS7GEA6_9BACT|nr:ABC transporter permease [Chitinophaga rhizophila]MBW8685999.1 ABC transporter permease [Chitinophaga rhizophila]